MSAPLETVLRGVRAILIGNGSSKFFLILFELVIAKAVGASAFGVYAIAIAASQIVSSLCVMGLNYGVVQHLAVYGEKGEQAKARNSVFYCLAAVGLVAGAAALLLFLCAEVLAAAFFGKPELASALAVTAPLLFFDALSQALSAVFRGLRQFNRNLLVFDFIKNALCLAALPALLFLGARVEEVLLVCLAGSFAGAAYGISALARARLFPARKEMDAGVLRELMDFSKLLFLWNLLQVLAVRLFILAAGVFLSTAETGALAVAARLALVFIFFQTAVNSTVHGEFARFHHLKDARAQKDLYQSVTQGLLGVVMVAAIPVLADPVFVTSAFGAGYTVYAWVIWPLLLAHLLNVVTGPAGQVLVANGKQRILMGLALFDVGMQMFLVVPLMHFYGVAGAAGGEAARITLFVVLRLWVLWRETGVHVFGRCYVPLLALSGAALGSALLLTTAGAGYFLATGYALAFYLAGGAWIFFMDERLKDELWMLLRISGPRVPS